MRSARATRHARSTDAARARAALSGPVRILIAAVLSAAAHVAVAQAPGGFFLVAKPTILDPNFSRTVVLVTPTPDGAILGMILNRPTKQSLAG